MECTTITAVRAREILDSRGNPTVEADVTLECGCWGRGAVPSGASTGAHEAYEKRDGGPRYGGKGVLQAVEHVNNEIAEALIGLDATDLFGVDQAMFDIEADLVRRTLADKIKHLSPEEANAAVQAETLHKRHLGANAILAVSIATARAAADCLGVPVYRYLGGAAARVLPVPMFNVLNGGTHANWEGTDFQEFMICPWGAPTYPEALRMGVEVYHALKAILKKKSQNVDDPERFRYSTSVGDEGGFVLKLKTNEDALKLIMEAIIKAGYVPGKDVVIALDPAATELYDPQKRVYKLHTENRELSHDDMIALYANWVAQYPIVSIEDGLAEDDWEGWQKLNARLGATIELVGDDLLVTNVGRIRRAIRERAANSVLIKMNQIGSVSETIQAIETARAAGFGAEFSHRSGETVDSFIAHFVVAMGCGHIKTGAPARGERLEKYNELLRINEEIGETAIYAGPAGFIHGPERMAAWGF